MVFLQLQEVKQHLIPLVVIIQLAILLLLLQRATLELGSMFMPPPTMYRHSRPNIAKLCRGTGFLLEDLKVQFLPHMAIPSNLEVGALHQHRQCLLEVAPPSRNLETVGVHPDTLCHLKIITGVHLVTKGQLATTTELLEMTVGAPRTLEGHQLIIEAQGSTTEDH